MHCEICRDLLLNHIYDLLGESEEADVYAHLATCQGCRAAKVRAMRTIVAATAARRRSEEVPEDQDALIAVA